MLDLLLDLLFRIHLNLVAPLLHQVDLRLLGERCRFCDHTDTVHEGKHCVICLTNCQHPGIRQKPPARDLAPDPIA